VTFLLSMQTEAVRSISLASSWLPETILLVGSHQARLLGKSSSVVCASNML
jgi:hypothetical protein